MAARKTTQELLEENARQRAAVLAKDEERKAKRRVKIDELDSELVVRIEKLQAKREELAKEREELNTTSTPVDEV